jgi:hypothetical protein
MLARNYHAARKKTAKIAVDTPGILSLLRLLTLSSHGKELECSVSVNVATAFAIGDRAKEQLTTIR